MDQILKPQQLSMEQTKKIFFVGVHNKLDMAPLDSNSKSGKLVDRTIAALQTEVGLFDADFIKTNLFPFLSIPENAKPGTGIHAAAWSTRNHWKPGDIVICLGAIVHTYFRGSGIPFIAIGHPSGVWSKIKQEEYIINACIKVSEVLRKQPTTLYGR